MDKQIEKLAKELDYCETHDCIGESCAKCRAIWLIENGYRKIPEGDVVLSRETWLEIQNYKYNLGFQTGTQIAHRKAIKEVLEKLNAKMEYDEHIFQSCASKIVCEDYIIAREDCQNDWKKWLSEVAKEMGVEL